MITFANLHKLYLTGGRWPAVATPKGSRQTLVNIKGKVSSFAHINFAHKELIIVQISELSVPTDPELGRQLFSIYMLLLFLPALLKFWPSVPPSVVRYYLQNYRNRAANLSITLHIVSLSTFLTWKKIHDHVQHLQNPPSRTCVCPPSNFPHFPHLPHLYSH